MIPCASRVFRVNQNGFQSEPPFLIDDVHIGSNCGTTSHWRLSLLGDLFRPRAAFSSITMNIATCRLLHLTETRTHGYLIITTMPHSDNKRPPPFSLRLTPDERQQLENQAGRLSLGAYIKAILFPSETAGQSRKPRTRSKSLVKDYKVLAEVLAKLGASRLASNINQLAKAVNSGSLPVTPETEAALQTACRDLRAIKHMLMKALGIRER